MSIEIENMKAKVSSYKTRRAPTFQLNFIIPVAIFSVLILTAIFAPLLAPYPPDDASLISRLKPPAFMEGGSSDHLLGTDLMGRDVLSRIIFGSRVSLSISLMVILITASVGTILGIIAGYMGGRVDTIFMRITDVSLSFPAIFVALLLAVVIGPGFFTVVLSLSILGWAPYARLIRGESLRLRLSDFVEQARIIGSSPFRIMTRHIFPNVVNPLIIIATMQVGLVILTEAALSYLGAGVPPSTPSWGLMVSDGRNLIDRAWWISFFPGIAIGLVVLSGNFLGDWVRDKLDPRLRQV
jgi:peptide/nickel transport system permease protein